VSIVDYETSYLKTYKHDAFDGAACFDTINYADAAGTIYLNDFYT
jgi:hypothetical protein